MPKCNIALNKPYINQAFDQEDKLDIQQHTDIQTNLNLDLPLFNHAAQRKVKVGLYVCVLSHVEVIEKIEGSVAFEQNLSTYVHTSVL